MQGQQNTVAVAGGGTMGAGIAQAFAAAGFDVTVLEASEPRLDAALRRIGAGLDRGAAKDGGDASAARARVRGTTAIGDLAGAGLVVEAIPEDREAKVALLRQVASVVSDDALITTNTSALAIGDLARAVTERGRFAGLHFFTPVHAMRLVEVVPGEETDERTVERLRAVVERLGSRPVVTRDRPGFLVNRVLLPYLNQALQAYDDGIATGEDIDLAVRLGLGYPIGPLELLDRIGLDVHLDATTAAYEQLHDEHFSAPPIVSRLVDAGRLGRKSGAGIYHYTEEHA